MQQARHADVACAPPSGFQPTGRRVAELRQLGGARGGFSVPEFAGLLRVSASTVYRWEAARGPLALRRSWPVARMFLTVWKRQEPRAMARALAASSRGLPCCRPSRMSPSTALYPCSG